MDSEVVVAGHICLDIIPTFTSDVELPPPGQLWQVGPAVVSTGGSVSNTGLALNRLGVDTRLMGKIGDDPLGRLLLDLVHSHNHRLSEGIIVAPGEITSYTIVVNPPERDRSFLHCAGANDTFCAEDLKLETISRSRLFHLGYPPLLAQMYADKGAGMVDLFRTVKSLGVTTSLDMVMFDPHSAAASADWRSIMRDTLPFVDLFLPSIEELLLCVDPDHYHRLYSSGDIADQATPSLLHQLSDLLLDWGAGVVALKLGHRGMYLRVGDRTRLARFGRACPADLGAWAGRELWAPVMQISRFGGTTGAGDAAIAGLLASLLRGRTAAESVTFACAAGGCCVEEADALSGLQPWNETWARLEAGWPRVPLAIDDSNWHFDPSSQLWEAG